VSTLSQFAHKCEVMNRLQITKIIYVKEREQPEQRGQQEQQEGGRISVSYLRVIPRSSKRSNFLADVKGGRERP